MQYMKEKENKVSDCLSRLFPVQENQDTLQNPFASTSTSNTDFDSELPNIETTENMQEKELERITVMKNIKNKEINADQLILETEIDEKSTPTWNREIYKECTKWNQNKTPTREVIKPNAEGKLWQVILKEREGQKDVHCILPDYDESKWLTKLDELNQDLMERKLTITRLHFGDPTLTPLEKIKVKNFINFICFEYPDQSFHTCYTTRTELTNAEKK